jgi:branched-chain amino acid transport system ATP-binding protein
MLDIRDLHVYYDGIHALKGISIHVPQGKIVTLIGANGAGKSSTLRAISGLVKNIKGSIVYNEREIAGKDPVDIVTAGIMMSPEGRKIFPHLSVLDNLMLGAYSRSNKAEIQKDLNWVYEVFPRLRERSSQKGGTLSGGEQQMLALARALMGAPDLILLDEPSLGLAPLLVKSVFDVIESINRMGKTVLLVEQNAFAALKIAHYAYVLEVGKIVLEGAGMEVMKNARVCEAYLGG